MTTDKNTDALDALHVIIGIDWDCSSRELADWVRDNYETIRAALSPVDVESIKREVYELTNKVIDECLGIAPIDGFYDVDSGNIQAIVGRVFDHLSQRGMIREAVSAIGPINSIALGERYQGKITEQEAIDLVNAVINSQLEIAATIDSCKQEGTKNEKR